MDKIIFINRPVVPIGPCPKFDEILTVHLR